MKKIFLMMLAAMVMAQPMAAQNYRQSKYYNQKTGHLDYGFGVGNETYYGLRLGPAFSTVNSDMTALDGNKTHTGLNVGAVIGASLSNSVPLYLESGLYYIEKGGKKKVIDRGSEDYGTKIVYNLNYLQVPIMVKYKIDVDDDFSIQPMAGGYLAMGVGGKIKNYATRQVRSSFTSDNFRRFDGGIRLGCGISYDLFYADLSWDIGLANICHDSFDSSHTSSVQLNFGVNF